MGRQTTENGADRGRARAGDRISVTALKSDGQPYRSWTAEVESIGEHRLVTLSRVGDPVHGPGGGWTQRHNIRTVYWFDRPYNLMEVYEPTGRLKQIYIHIASAPVLHGSHLVYTDHELDVVRRHGQKARVVDEDEFEAAAVQFGYTCEFRDSCRRAVKDALRLVHQWHPMGPPQWI